MLLGAYECNVAVHGLPAVSCWNPLLCMRHILGWITLRQCRRGLQAQALLADVRRLNAEAVVSVQQNAQVLAKRDAAIANASRIQADVRDVEEQHTDPAALHAGMDCANCEPHGAKPNAAAAEHEVRPCWSLGGERQAVSWYHCLLGVQNIMFRTLTKQSRHLLQLYERCPCAGGNAPHRAGAGGRPARGHRPWAHRRRAHGSALPRAGGTAHPRHCNRDRPRRGQPQLPSCDL